MSAVGRLGKADCVRARVMCGFDRDRAARFAFHPSRSQILSSLAASLLHRGSSRGLAYFPSPSRPPRCLGMGVWPHSRWRLTPPTNASCSLTQPTHPNSKTLANLACRYQANTFKLVCASVAEGELASARSCSGQHPTPANAASALHTLSLLNSPRQYNLNRNDIREEVPHSHSQWCVERPLAAVGVAVATTCTNFRTVLAALYPPALHDATGSTSTSCRVWSC